MLTIIEMPVAVKKNDRIFLPDRVQIGHGPNRMGNLNNLAKTMWRMLSADKDGLVKPPIIEEVDFTLRPWNETHRITLCRVRKCAIWSARLQSQHWVDVDIWSRETTVPLQKIRHLLSLVPID